MKILDAPIAYTIQYLQPRSSKLRNALISGVTPVHVDSCNISDAPVAVSATRTDDGTTVNYRWFGGDLYQPIREIDPRIGERIEVASVTNPLVPRGSYLRTHSEDVKDLSELPIKEITSTTRDDAIALANDRAGQLLLIDGVLHEESFGPMICLKPIDGGKRFSVESVDFFSLSDDVAAGLLFRADQRDLAIEVAGRIFPKKPSQIAADQPEIHIPQALVGDAASTSISMLGRRIFETAMTKTTMGSLPTPYLEAWLDYTAVGANRTRLGDDLLSTILKAGEALRSHRDHAKLAREVDWFIQRMEVEFAPVPTLSP